MRPAILKHSTVIVSVSNANIPFCNEDRLFCPTLLETSGIPTKKNAQNPGKASLEAYQRNQRAV